jgi:hypothetical protein
VKAAIAMRTALSDPALLGRALAGPSWEAWRAMLIAANGERLNAAEREVFQRFTGRQREPGQRIEERVYSDCVYGHNSSVVSTALQQMHVQQWACFLLFELIRVFGDIFFPKLLHHAVNFMWPMVITVLENIAQLPLVQRTGGRTSVMRRESRPRRSMRNAFSSHNELVACYWGRHVALLQS